MADTSSIVAQLPTAGSLSSITDPSAIRTLAQNYASQAQYLGSGYDPAAAAQAFSNNGAGVSFQELQGILGAAPAPSAAPSGGGGNINGLTPADIASLNQSISNTNSALDTLGATHNAGNADINTSLSNALQTLLQGKTAADQTYGNTQKADKGNYVTGKNTIGANAGSALNGLLRLLGSRGAGGGSAYNVAAPGAVAREATLQRNTLGQTYAGNEQALDTNYGNYVNDYNDKVANANTNAGQSRNDLAHNISLQKANLLQTLAGYQAQAGQGASAYQGNLDQANQILAQQAGYRSVAPLQTTITPYSAPSLSSYTTNPYSTPTVQGQAQANDYTSPYLQALLKNKTPATAGV